MARIQHPTKKSLELVVAPPHYQAIERHTAWFLGELVYMGEQPQNALMFFMLSVFGKEGEPTYGDLRKPDLREEITRVTTGFQAIATPKVLDAYIEVLGQLHIMTRLTQDGKLPLVQADGVRFELITDGMHDGRALADPPLLSLTLDWVNQELVGFRHTVRWQGLDIPVTDAGIKEKTSNKLHAWFMQVLASFPEHERPSVLEILGYLLHEEYGQHFLSSNPVFCIKALTDPERFGLEFGMIEVTVTEARNWWRTRCANLYIQIDEDTSQKGPMAPAMKDLGRLLKPMDVLKENIHRDMLVFVYAEEDADVIPDIKRHVEPFADRNRLLVLFVPVTDFDDAVVDGRKHIMVFPLLSSYYIQKRKYGFGLNTFAVPVWIKPCDVSRSGWGHIVGHPRFYQGDGKFLSSMDPDTAWLGFVSELEKIVSRVDRRPPLGPLHKF